MDLPIASSVREENGHSGSLPEAESSFNNEHLKENSGSGSLDLTKLNLENPQDIGRLLLQELMENGTARSAVPDLEEKKKWSPGKRKQICRPYTKPIYILDPWNRRKIPTAPGSFDPDVHIRNPMKRYQHLASLDAVKLREFRPDYIPVIAKKDARSDIPDVDTKKYHVYGGTPLTEFIEFLRIRVCTKRPIFVFFKNTKPPKRALMSAIHEENKDEDGFLHVIYSGENIYINENSHGGSFDSAESSFKQENQLERMQAEENNPDPIPMIVEKAPAKSDIPDNQEKKSLPEKTRKRASIDLLKNMFVYLDPWNSRQFKMALSSSPGMSENMRKVYLEKYNKLYGNLSEEQRTHFDAKQLREKRPDLIPVTLEKDPRCDSDIPDIDIKKYHVPHHKTLGQFIVLMRMGLAVGYTFPVRVFCKNTEPPVGALMSAIDNEFKDDDGFLHLTYSGERICESNENPRRSESMV